MYCSDSETKTQVVYTHKTVYEDCAYPRFWAANVDPKGCPTYKRIACRNRRCHCKECRNGWARVETAILQKSFKTKPPDYFVTLKTRFTNGKDLWTCFKNFTDKLRYRCGRFDYFMVVEFSNPLGTPHIHMLVRAGNPIHKRSAKEAWTAACGDRETSVYWEPCRYADGAAAYITKYNRGPVQVLETWEGRLQSCSRSFLSKPRAELWADVKLDWFGPPAPEDNNEDKLHSRYGDKEEKLEVLPAGNNGDKIHSRYGSKEEKRQQRFTAEQPILWHGLHGTIVGFYPGSGYSIRLPSVEIGSLPDRIRDKLYRLTDSPLSVWRARGIPIQELSLSV